MSGDDHSNTTETRDLDALHKSALALVAKMEALGCEFPDYTSGDHLNLDAVVEHYSSWHGNADNDAAGSAIEAGWSHADHGETLSHFIVREDVPALVAEVRRLRARDARMLAMADMIERGEWGQPWRDLNVHGAIRSEIRGVVK